MRASDKAYQALLDEIVDGTLPPGTDLADVEQSKLYELWQEAKKQKVSLPNIGLLTDIIACPGGDFCSLANAKSLPIAKALQERFDDLDYLFDLGDISLNISGCINSCGHHHVGNIDT